MNDIYERLIDTHDRLRGLQATGGNFDQRARLQDELNELRSIARLTAHA